MTAPKKIARGQIVLVVILSVLSGVFIIQGLSGAIRGDVYPLIQLILAPALLAIAILHARRVWQAIP